MASCKDLFDLHSSSLFRRAYSGEEHRQRCRAALAVHLRLRVASHRGSELLELLDYGVVLLAVHRFCFRCSLSEETQSLMKIVIRACFLAVEAQQAVLGG